MQSITISITWVQFKTDFTAYFQYTSSKDEAQKKLNKLQQGKGTANEYITLFKGLAPATQFGEEALLQPPLVFSGITHKYALLEMAPRSICLVLQAHAHKQGIPSPIHANEKHLASA